MRILVALIAVFMVSVAVAQVDFDANDVQFSQQKKQRIYRWR